MRLLRSSSLFTAHQMVLIREKKEKHNSPPIGAWPEAVESRNHGCKRTFRVKTEEPKTTQYPNGRYTIPLVTYSKLAVGHATTFPSHSVPVQRPDHDPRKREPSSPSRPTAPTRVAIPPIARWAGPACRPPPYELAVASHPNARRHLAAGPPPPLMWPSARLRPCVAGFGTRSRHPRARVGRPQTAPGSASPRQGRR